MEEKKTSVLASLQVGINVRGEGGNNQRAVEDSPVKDAFCFFFFPLH